MFLKQTIISLSLISSVSCFGMGKPLALQTEQEKMAFIMQTAHEYVNLQEKKLNPSKNDLRFCEKRFERAFGYNFSANTSSKEEPLTKEEIADHKKTLAEQEIQKRMRESLQQQTIAERELLKKQLAETELKRKNIIAENAQIKKEIETINADTAKIKKELATHKATAKTKKSIASKKSKSSSNIYHGGDLVTVTQEDMMPEENNAAQEKLTKEYLFKKYKVTTELDLINAIKQQTLKINLNAAKKKAKKVDGVGGIITQEERIFGCSWQYRLEENLLIIKTSEKPENKKPYNKNEVVECWEDISSED